MKTIYFAAAILCLFCGCAKSDVESRDFVKLAESTLRLIENGCSNNEVGESAKQLRASASKIPSTSSELLRKSSDSFADEIDKIHRLRNAYIQTDIKTKRSLNSTYEDIREKAKKLLRDSEESASRGEKSFIDSAVVALKKMKTELGID